MDRGRGSKQIKGLLGMKGASLSTGPQEGLGAGQRNPGTPEDTKFQGKRLRPRELNPGQIVGSLPADDPAPKGDAQVPVRPISQEALQRMAERVESEVLPAEYREQILRYMELMRQPAAGAGGGVEGEDAQGAVPDSREQSNEN